MMMLTSYLEAETNWELFRNRHFSMQIPEGKVWISVHISLKFVPKVKIVNP